VQLHLDVQYIDVETGTIFIKQTLARLIGHFKDDPTCASSILTDDAEQSPERNIQQYAVNLSSFARYDVFYLYIIAAKRI